MTKETSKKEITITFEELLSMLQKAYTDGIIFGQSIGKTNTIGTATPYWGSGVRELDFNGMSQEEIDDIFFGKK